MNEQYMADFMAVFSAVERWGPGSDQDTLKALQSLQIQPQHILDIGCGKGFATRILAQHTLADIVAVDNEPAALSELQHYAETHNITNRIKAVSASMTELPFASNTFDLIWCEASAYIMGFEQALQQWRPLLKDNGYLVISDLLWLTRQPSAEATNFWLAEYPDMQDLDERLSQIESAGYVRLDHFTLSEQAWRDYYVPVKARVAELKSEMPNSVALADIEREIAIFEQHLGEFGYQMFVLQAK